MDALLAVQAGPLSDDAGTACLDEITTGSADSARVTMSVVRFSELNPLGLDPRTGGLLADGA